VRRKIDVIVAANSPAGRAAKNATKTIPIVIPFMSDPVGDGFAASLAHPGSNITGLTNEGPEAHRVAVRDVGRAAYRCLDVPAVCLDAAPPARRRRLP
jgi:putative tryptophan/tyrosine transport system substrate-binding protein